MVMQNNSLNESLQDMLAFITLNGYIRTSKLKPHYPKDVVLLHLQQSLLSNMEAGYFETYINDHFEYEK